jgi:DNA topoisomerase VI subunit B
MTTQLRTSRKPRGRAVQLEVDFTPPAAEVKRLPVEAATEALRQAESAPSARTTKRGRGTSKPLSAVEMAARQRDISVAEFFSKNRHLLGFDNPSKALLTTVKEAVDNSLDACEEAHILPDLRVEIHRLAEDRFRVVVQDNGPGIVRNQVPKIFGRLLYGSKFHSMKQSRGQQGIGISAAGMYGLQTTGKPIAITSRTGRSKPGHYFELTINTAKNQAEILIDREIEWDLDHGTRVEITLQATYKKGRHSVDGYLRQIAIANPHARIAYFPPDPSEDGGALVFERVSRELPPEPLEIKPHPHGVELGVFLKMLKETTARTLGLFLQKEFSRVSPKVAEALLDEARLAASQRPHQLTAERAEALHASLSRVKIMAPPTNCISPIGEELLRKALEAEVEADFYATVTRPPAVYRGNPFQVEVGLAYGGSLPPDEPVTVYRYANRVPLLYQQSACAVTKAVLNVDWKGYHLSQARGALPAGPAILIVHVASVWVPFTSESKEAIAHYPEILREIRLALQEAGRRVSLHISRTRRDKEEGKKRSYIQKYIPHIGVALQEILGLTDVDRQRTVEVLTQVLEHSRGGEEE